MATIHTTYQLRGYLPKSGYAQLDDVLRECSVLYNASLQEWRDAYSIHVGWKHLIDRETDKRVRTKDDVDWVYIPQRSKRIDANPPTYYDQLKEFTVVRADDSYWNNLDANIGRGVIQRLERAKNAFFRRVKEGDKPGYPRFKSARRWRTIEMAMVRPGMVKNGKVKIKGLPPIAIPEKRELPPSVDLKSLRITKMGRRVMVSLGYQVEREALPVNPACVGIDLGVTDRMVLSTGQIMIAGGDIPTAGLDPAEIPIFGQPILRMDSQGVAPDVAGFPVPSHKIKRRRTNRLDITKKQQRLARCQKGSRRRRERAAILANAHSRVKISNRNQCHRITTDIIQRFYHIGIEALQITNMTRSAKGTLEKPGTNVNAKSGLNREILTQTWGIIRQQLAYKAEWAGRRLVEVNPRNTSRTCAVCGVIDGASRDGKAFYCVACGHSDDADHNAAVNILRMSLAGGNTPLLAGEPA